MSDVFDIQQTDRLLNIAWSGATQAMILTRFQGTEQISGLFSFQLDVVSPLDSITVDQIVGTEIAWSVRQPDGSRRPFAGIAAQLGEGTSFGRDYRRYSLEIRPSFWLLTHTSNCRIFQNQTVPQIIAAVLGAYPQVKFDLGGLNASYAPRVYCVQYRESDFAFVTRLMEDEGIFYYFRHSDDGHVMVLGDNAAAWFTALPMPVPYGVQADVGSTIGRWRRGSRFRAGRWTQRDYNFETPGNSLNASVATVLTPGQFKAFEHYDYPGGYGDMRSGEARSLLRMEGEESGFQDIEAESNIPALATGSQFQMEDYEYASDDAGGWILRSVTHEASDYSHVTGEGDNAAPSYANSFRAFAESVRFRPPRDTPRPVISGLQSATVTGPAGEEIYTDQYGRIKVQFPWDRQGQNNENSSCWMRVVQSLGGGQWGAEFLPRVGQEVLISFLEGDPDRPVVMGGLYNARNMPPYKLPDHKTKMTLRSQTYKGAGSNELSFEDATDGQQVYMHAQKDFLRVVEHDDTLEVVNDQARAIGHDRSTTVKHDDTLDVTNNQSVTIGQSQSITVKAGDCVVTVSQGTYQLDVGASHITLQNDGTIMIKGSTIILDADEILVQGSDTVTVKGGKIFLNP